MTNWSIGVDIGGTKILLAHVDADGFIQQRILIETDIKKRFQGVFDQIVDAARQLIQQAPIAPVGIGVGIAGQVQPKTGHLIFAPNLHWRDIPLQASLADAMQLPTIVTNDVRAITFGEWNFGAGRGYQEVVCLFVGTGVGGGIIAEGRLLEGASNSAGEFGHMIIDLHGPKCTCGSQGCLETYAAGWAIAKAAQEAIQKDPNQGKKLLALAAGEPMTTKIVGEGFHSKDPLSMHIIDNAVEALVAGCVNIVNTINPQVIILGGGVIEGIPELVQRIDTGMRDRALPSAAKAVRILHSQLKGDAGVIGSAALSLGKEKQYLNP